MFEKEAEEYKDSYFGFADERISEVQDFEGNYIDISERIMKTFIDGAEFGYNKAKEELTERLDNATEIIETMKDLFFGCWQEKGLKAIKFEQRVNDFLKGV